MSTLALPSSPLLKLWRDLHSRFRFKFLLPTIRTAKLEGIKLDISTLSPLMKNYILTGRYEVQERRLASKALNKNDVVLELGGAIGFIGLYCRKVLGVKHVTSVEANPSTLEILRRNYERNGLTPHVIHAAAASEDGELDLNIGGEFWENSLVTKHDGKTVTVPALSLGSIIKIMPESPTTLVCDIEGAEQYLDFTQLPTTVKTIIIELHPEIIGQERVDEILTKFDSMEFKISAQEAGTWLLER